MDNNSAIFLEYINNMNLKNYEIFVITPEGIKILIPDYVNSSNNEEIKSKIREYEDALFERSKHDTDPMNMSEAFSSLNIKLTYDKYLKKNKLKPNPFEPDIYPHSFSDDPDPLQNNRDI